MKTQPANKICSSASIEELEKLINEYYYSTSYKINRENLSITNKNGIWLNGFIIHKKGRYTYYQKTI